MRVASSLCHAFLPAPRRPGAGVEDGVRYGYDLQVRLNYMKQDLVILLASIPKVATVSASVAH
jgi:hypothetical protein